MKLDRALRVFVIALPLLILAYLPASYLFALASTGYGWSEMDWNQDGSTSLGEVLESTDIGKSEVIVDGRQCAEYWYYKDGMPFRTICP